MCKLWMAAFVAFAVGGPVRAQSFSDDFNRPDSSDLGANWLTVVPKMQILSNEAVNGGTTHGMATVVPFSAPYLDQRVSVDVQAGSSDGYVALILAAGTSDYMVAADSHQGVFAGYRIYWGNAEVTIASGLLTPFSTARMSAWIDLYTAADPNFSRNRIHVGFDTNFDGTNEQESFGVTPIDANGLGNGIGLGIMGDARADNYMATVPEPCSLIAMGAALAALVARRRKR